MKILNCIKTSGKLDGTYGVLKQSKKFLKLKILGSGEIKKNIEISAHFVSKQALTKIEKAGGKIKIIKK